MAQKEENMDVDLTHKQRKLMDGAKKEETVSEVGKKEEKLPDLLPTLPTSPIPMLCSKKQSAIAAAMLTVKKVKEKVQTYNKEMEKLKMKEKDGEQEEHEQILIEGSDEDKDEVGKEKELKGGKGGKMTRSKFRNLRKKKEEQEIMDKFKFEVHLEEPVHLRVGDFMEACREQRRQLAAERKQREKESKEQMRKQGKEQVDEEMIEIKDSDEEVTMEQADKHTIQVKLLSEHAACPERSNCNAAAFDLTVAANASIERGEIKKIQTHLQIILPDNYFGLILPRSGWSTKGLQVKIGLVDACYMGQIIIMATQTKLDKWHVTKGDRLAQILIMENRLPKLPKIVLSQAFQTEEEDTQQLESLEEMEDQKEKEDSQKEEEEEAKIIHHEGYGGFGSSGFGEKG